MRNPQVKIVECPREAWQDLPSIVPPEIKADYLRILVAAGFKHIDAVSFPGRAEIPQKDPRMADSEIVLEYLDPPDDVEIIALVTGVGGAERAARTGAVQTVTFPYSVSPLYLEQTLGQKPEESIEIMEQIGEIAYKSDMELAASVSMAFGNHLGNLRQEPWSIDEVVAACDLLVDSGIRQITLTDTTARATPSLIAEVIRDVLVVHEEIELGVHLYAHEDRAADLIAAAWHAGCRRFDSSIGGFGSGPIAEDRLASNLPTELLLSELGRLGAGLPEMRPLTGLASASAEIARKFGAKIQ